MARESWPAASTAVFERLYGAVNAAPIYHSTYEAFDVLAAAISVWLKRSNITIDNGVQKHAIIVRLVQRTICANLRW